MRLILFLLFFSLAQATECYFIPPTGWEIAQLKSPSPHVKVGFIGKGSADFRPSINLATEEVDVSLNDYVKAVKELNKSDPTSQWRDLGKIPMKGGQGRLVEITSSSPWGETKILQAFLVVDHTAYILTAAVSKEDFFTFQSELLKSFRSLTTIPTLWAPILDPAQQEIFKNLFAALGGQNPKEQQWKTLQDQVKSHSDLGPYWQFLVLQEGHAKIFKGDNL